MLPRDSSYLSQTLQAAEEANSGLSSYIFPSGTLGQLRDLCLPVAQVPREYHIPNVEDGNDRLEVGAFSKPLPM